MTDALSAATPVELGSQLVEKGDAALILKRDGSVQAVTFGIDRSRLSLPSDQHTEEDQKAMLQGAKLFALAFAAGNQKLLNTLMNIASDPDVIDFDTLTATKTRH